MSVPVPTEPTNRRTILREAIGVWLLSVVIIAALGLLAMVVPFVSTNLLAFVAATFLYLPAWILWRRRVDLSSYGLTTAPLGRGIVHVVLIVLVTFPPFVFGWAEVQTRLFDRTVELDAARMARFDRTLDDRPEFPLAQGKLHVWVEGGQLFVVWPGTDPIEVNMHVAVASGAPLADARGVAPTTDGLNHADRGRLQVKMSGEVVWSRPNAGGLRFSLDRVSALRIEASVPLASGRWSVATDSPLETERTSWWWVFMMFNQLVLVALPEEWFFRGYLQQRLDEVWAPRWRILGAQLGWGWIASSVMFALGHLVHSPSPHRLAVFFPSLLFGWLRARTDSVLACTVYHAACNVLAQALVYTFV